MDWSLVLISQGIQTIIHHSDEGGWSLMVASRDLTPAVRVLRQYRLENTRWPWRQTLFDRDLLFDWGCLGWVLLIGVFFWISENAADLRTAGMMDRLAVTTGEWWRLFTAVLLHADLGHFAANASIGLVLLGLAMGRYGTGVGLLAAFVAGVGGNVATLTLYSGEHRSLGASGMVMGCLGLLAAQSVSLWREHPRGPKYVLTGIVGGVMLFVLLGLSPGTDVMAHFGGFASGVILGVVLALVPRLTKSSAGNIFAGIVFTALVILSWWLALGAHAGATR
jgi:rhomboid protease GluP